MSIVYLGYSQAKKGQEEKLRALLASFVLPKVRASEGNEACRLYESDTHAGKFVVVEVWASSDAHRASVRDIPPDKINEFVGLLEQPPHGEYYREVDVPNGEA